MRFAVIDHIAPAQPFDRLPLKLEQASSGISTVVLLVLAAPVAMALMAPFGLVVAHAATRPGTLAVIALRPIAAIELACGFLFGTLMFGLLLWRLVLQLGRGRTVIIADGHVTVRERGPFRNRLWSAPLSRFVGVAHRVRSTLTGIRHEIMLVHPECARSVLLEIGDRIEQARIDEVSGLLGLRQVPAHALYGVPNSTVIAPNATLQTAPA